MSVRPIIKSDSPTLRMRSKEVKEITPALQRLLDDMLETMRAEPGVGLAAPQLGVLQRAIVVELPREEEEPLSGCPIFLINPAIVEANGEEERAEGCLSVPGYMGDVVRATQVTVEGLNRRGRPVRFKAQGFLARVLQHEIDHLDGMLFLDRLTSLAKLRKLPPEDGGWEYA
ncbi:MAG: peptide deformylase [Anaerolineae bacterium]